MADPTKVSALERLPVVARADHLTVNVALPATIAHFRDAYGIALECTYTAKAAACAMSATKPMPTMLMK